MNTTSDAQLTVALVGCGRMGQAYAEFLLRQPDVRLAAIAEVNAERRQAVAARFGVNAVFEQADELFASLAPDVAIIVLPGKYIQAAVEAAIRAGVRGIQVEKPIGAVLRDVDAMIDACEDAGIVFAGGALQRAMPEVQQAAARLRAGDFGPLRGACVHRYGGEISGGGCQHIAMLRLFTGAEITEVRAWGEPQEALAGPTDEGLNISGQFVLSNDLICPIFSGPTPNTGVDVWTDDTLVRWDWAPPQILRLGDDGAAHAVQTDWQPPADPEAGYLGTSARSFFDVVRRGVDHQGDLLVSARDLRSSLEAAIGARHSAQRGHAPVALPLADRSLALYPRAYRWLGGDQSGNPQSVEEAQRGPEDG